MITNGNSCRHSDATESLTHSTTKKVYEIYLIVKYDMYDLI